MPLLYCFKYFNYMLLLLLCCFSRVRFCATPQTAAHQASLSLGFSRQEHWSGLPFPAPMHESESEVTQLRPALHDPVDYSLPGSSVHGILILKSGCVRNSTLLFSKMALAICGPMRFHLKFRMNFYTSAKNTIGSLILIELNL